MTDEEMQRLKQEIAQFKVKRKGRFSKRIISFIIVLNLLFTLSILYIFLKTGNEPMTLIGSFFGFTTIELWNLAKIKQQKIKGNEEQV